MKRAPQSQLASRATGCAPGPLRSLARLDLDLAWRRVLSGLDRSLDVPDRLPFCLANRVRHGRPRLAACHQFSRPLLVAATKRDGSCRNLARLTAADLLLYQALVDALAPDLEAALEPRETVFGFRQDLSGAEDPFHASPTWTDFHTRVRERLKVAGGYALTVDVEGFYAAIDLARLEVKLLGVTRQRDVVRDLITLLVELKRGGVCGLPQGIAPSGPLANLYLRETDRFLASRQVSFCRHRDDVWIFAESHRACVQHLRGVARVLSRDRLAVATQKVSIRTSRAAFADTQPFAEAVAARMTRSVEWPARPCSPSGEGHYDAESAALRGEYDACCAETLEGTITPSVDSQMAAAIRYLAKRRDPYAVSDVPAILARRPHLTAIGLRYLAAVAKAERQSVLLALRIVTDSTREYGENELLHVCRAAMRLAQRCDHVSRRMADLARFHEHPLVRARAVLAWGAQSRDADFSVRWSRWLCGRAGTSPRRDRSSGR